MPPEATQERPQTQPAPTKKTVLLKVPLAELRQRWEKNEEILLTTFAMATPVEERQYPDRANSGRMRTTFVQQVTLLGSTGARTVRLYLNSPEDAVPTDLQMGTRVACKVTGYESEKAGVLLKGELYLIG